MLVLNHCPRDQREEAIHISTLAFDSDLNTRAFDNSVRPDSLVDYVQTHRQELSATMIDTIKRNPLPTLLIGAGVGWLLTDMLSSSPKERVRYPIQHYDAYDDRPDWQRPSGYRTEYDRNLYAVNEIAIYSRWPEVPTRMRPIAENWSSRLNSLARGIPKLWYAPLP